MIFGKHYLIELSDCDSSLLVSTTEVEKALIAAAKLCGATYVSHNSHQFTPHGATAFVLLKESHLAIHTWPEHGYAAVDFFSCSDDIKIEVAVNSLQDAFLARKVSMNEVERGTQVDSIVKRA